MSKRDFLSFYSRYRGEIEPKHLIFNANLQKFSQEVGYICNLETAGKNHFRTSLSKH
ncbi:hypothetical protein Ple7327_1706 [Pleurocapsa sp. PCC 7327]|nr:hypothetical protein Ple7327_1706 [Pleurocapsa sp. PCC 7327]